MVEFHSTFSRHAIVQTSLALVIWLNEKVQYPSGKTLIADEEVLPPYPRSSYCQKRFCSSRTHAG